MFARWDLQLVVFAGWHLYQVWHCSCAHACRGEAAFDKTLVVHKVSYLRQLLSVQRAVSLVKKAVQFIVGIHAFCVFCLTIRRYIAPIVSRLAMALGYSRKGDLFTFSSSFSFARDSRWRERDVKQAPILICTPSGG